jgi:hypothetical protein
MDRFSLPQINAPSSIRKRPVALAGQCVGVAGVLAVLALAPPARGAMLLVPVASDAGGMVGAAVHAGARLIGAGPLPGSVVVEAERAALLPLMIRRGALVTAANPAACGRATRA